jgi:phage shock protein PspC (stress-responsive transcriptional regulator)
MKKIININLNGRVIPIEDSAYEKLQGYIESLRRYFANEEGRDEIINDIESRISELLHEKIRKGADSITDTDIEDIISSMGRVEDFEEVTADTADNSKENKQQSSQSQAGSQQNFTFGANKTRGRLYRDTSDKFIGGVCSGIAAYMNVDPAIVRILFAIITFGGFGLGFIVYIALWAILPPKDLEGYTGKRLYRNPDDKVIGGVAGGLAAYFGKSTKMIRLIFAAPILLSILVGFINGFNWNYGPDVVLNVGTGSLSGTFFLIYIVLWMVLPEANSDYEKMEMRGETVDVNRIRQNVREGMDSMKDRMKGWTDEVKETAQNFSAKAREFSNTRGRAFATEVNETVRRSRGGIGHAIGVIFKAFFLFIAGTIAFALFVSLIALLFGGVAWWPINSFLWTSKWQQIFAWGTLIFFLIVPLIGFIIWVVRRIIRTKSRNNYLGWTFGFLWTIGWVSVILLVASVSKDFRYYETSAQDIAIVQPVNNKMVVAVSQPELEYNGNFGWLNDGGYGWNLSSDSLSLSGVKITVNPSPAGDPQYHVTLKKYSAGSSKENAYNRASKIQYNISSIDSVLDLGNGYSVDKDSKFRGQNVEIEILVPIGKKIRFDESVKEKLNMVNVRIKRSYRRNRVSGFEINTDDRAFNYRTGVDYIMGIDGILKDPAGNPAVKPVNNDYRYNETDTVINAEQNNDLQQQLDEEKRHQDQIQKDKEESQRKQKEIEDKIKAAKGKPTGFNRIKTKDDAATFAGGPSPVSSLVEWF